jgi:transposase
LLPFLPQLQPARRQPISRLLDALAKVIADDVLLDGTGYPTERTQKGHYRIASATDLDATFRQHDDDLTLGYNVAIATTGTRITAAVVQSGAVPDSEAPEALLRQQLAAGRALPRYVVMDRAAGWGKCRARVDVVSQSQTMQVALVPPAGGADPARFGPANFRVNAERTTCTCPRGVVSTHGYVRGDGDGIRFRFLASDCRGCEDWTDCRGLDGKPKAHRMVFISDYQAYLRQALAFNQTAEGKALLGQRWQVEPEVAWLTRYQGCRTARCLGQEAAQFQVWQACALRNLLRWLSRTGKVATGCS